MSLILEQPIEVWRLAVCPGCAEVDVRCDMRVRWDKPQHDVSSLAEVEIVCACRQWLRPHRHRKPLSHRERVRQQNVPLLCCRRYVQCFLRIGFKKSHKDLCRLRQREVDRRLLLCG